ncbi:electron transfer flavoprotein-ubiquinone oxidoreductase [Gallaecimonas kandeliae]|uniref:electron transfer flavoprotein-ubiquinone oxidoreductase n=1 Tax=Gallaecimonas kandeliae TaxID=3029055 RepID=UPI0026474B37|nr:electron transfer flavoprotein-ubiquinone oxidoreductase [Gallaecimonas kandeliae]WKE66827.1 electron transfer flavoprotein-ubiquinone oxidoreductase [Gallaecimonas kandeliae]
MQRETMEFDVVVVGAGPAGLSAACRLKQLDPDLMVCVVEKGSEVGAHILSGALFEPRALTELFPDWQQKGAPLNTAVAKDELYLLEEAGQKAIPHWAIPRPMHNDGNYIISLGNLCRWLAEQAESLGVEIYPGFPAAEIIFDDNGKVVGIQTGDMGRLKDGSEGPQFQPGMNLLAKQTLFAEGCRGHLGKELLERFKLADGKEPQHYAIGFKELWQVPKDKHKPGLVVHAGGWPLDKTATGGSFLYHLEDGLISVGLIVDLNYKDPYLSPFEEFQRMKQHPLYAQYLEGGERISYGARAIAKGGLNSLPRMAFPGGMLIGCDAGTLNFAKIKGSHTAMKSGMLAAEAVIADLKGEEPLTAATFEGRFKASWLHEELHCARNFGAALHKWGPLLGGAYNWVEQNILGGKAPWTLSDPVADHLQLETADRHQPRNYPKPDGKLSFDRLSSVFISNTNHEENQPCHLKLKDQSIPVAYNLPRFDEPAQRYCPAGVYEIVEEADGKRLQINAQNCIHCKTCDIKDPSQNIQWVTPEGAGGPNYPNM